LLSSVILISQFVAAEESEKFPLRCSSNQQIRDAPFDIHYADANGSEIPPEQALKAVPAIKKKTAKPEQWTLSDPTSEQGRA